MRLSDWAAVTVAVLALFFTVASFWWLYARLGRIRLADGPRSFALSFSGGRLLLTLPLAFVNDGPTPIVIVNLRLTEPATGFTGTFVATHDEVYGDKGRAFATGFVVGGNEARVVICEFQGPRIQPLSKGELTLTLEASERRLRGGSRWRSLGTFQLRIDDLVLRQQGAWLAYDNDPQGP